MRRWSLIICLLIWAGLAAGEEVELNRDNPVKCEGMYSQKAWGGSTQPYIMVRFSGYEPKGDEDTADPVIAAVIFEYSDNENLGRELPSQPGKPHYLCDDQAIREDLCTQEDFGTYIHSPEATTIETTSTHIKQPSRGVLKHNIERTGYYCVSTDPMAPNQNAVYKAVVEFRNAYGELPGAQIPKLPFYGGLAIVYAVVGAFWAFLYVQNRSDVLPVQNYITATIVFLVVEMIMTWGYYDFMNNHGSNLGSKVFMLVVSILNAARNSLSFFLLLIVCMGYGVVKPTLGKTMRYVQILAIVHFVFGVIYAVGSLTIKPEDAGPLVLLVVLPLAATGTAFYVWTLNALGATLKDLYQRKQRIKAMMYRKLWWCILASVLVIFGFFVLNILFFSGQGNPDFTPQHWRTRWFMLDGWLSLVYLADVAFVAYLWRPTVNNRRFAMSDEISQDDEGFEIASVRDSLDEMDDQETGGANGGSNSLRKPSHGSLARDESPLPAPQPQRPPGRVRDNLDGPEGETLFAVGEGDRFSDDESDEGERRGLTRKAS